MDPMKLDLSEARGARVAAEASSKSDGRDRWTELSVWFVPSGARPWVAEAKGCSNRVGERDKVRRMASASLERALRLFDDSDLGVIVKEGAREWAEEEGIPTLPPQYAPADDREALAMLMGVKPEDLSVCAAADALGVGESSLRMALKNKSAVRVPLRTVMPFIDRAAFQRAQAGDKSRG